MQTTTVSAFLRFPEVQAITGVPRSTIYKMARAGDFPSPVSITPKTVAFRRDQIEAWINSRLPIYASASA